LQLKAQEHSLGQTREQLQAEEQQQTQLRDQLRNR
jgi:hypothetical protein